MQLSWKNIDPVPDASQFLDIVLSRTQRKTPTVIRSGFKIGRIKSFYERKIKFTEETFVEKFDAILTGFPKLEEVHPFIRDLMNVLYDRDHYKVALSQLSTAKHLIQNVARDYVRLVKYGQSLFQCKQLKRAALGRMATITRRMKDPLLYLEQVRQHLGRLPSIDPNTRTLLICGYPNVGKSSFLRSITRADVEVQPYAFTTKSLFVGHFDYKYLRWQAIDTPGILDHPLEEMNTIEMQSITAIAHLRAAILYFMDLSEECGYSVQAQMKLFQSIKPLFANKVVILVINKIDRMTPEKLDKESLLALETLTNSPEITTVRASCTTQEGVMNVKNAACEQLLASRVEQKMKGTKVNEVLNKIHLAQPMARDDVPRLPNVPESAKNRTKYDESDPNRTKLARDLEAEFGGPGVFNVDLKNNFILASDDWKHDKMAEIFNGKNVYDFIDPDIEAKLAALEAEEEQLEKDGFYQSDDEIEDDETAEVRAKAAFIREKKRLIQNAASSKKSLKNRAIIPRKATSRTLSQMETELTTLGLDHSRLSERARSRSQATRSRLEASERELKDVEMADTDNELRPTPQYNRREAGLKNEVQRTKTERITKLSQRKRNRMARAGEADRHIAEKKPKHLYAGKRGMGKTQRR